MPVPRLYVDAPLAAGGELALPQPAARHVRVLRLQPGAALTLFDGRGGQWDAEVRAIGRRDVTATVLARHAVERELCCRVTLALGMPANERMDTLVEKATELGAATIQPLHCERSVLRVSGERAERRCAHWRAIALAACEQCGRNRPPEIAVPAALPAWLASLGPDSGARLLLCAPGAAPGGASAGAAAPRATAAARSGGRQAPTDDRPAEADHRPAEADHRPAEADGRPAEADSMPGDADGLPAEADGLPAEAGASLWRYLGGRLPPRVTLLSGPEGGLSDTEAALAIAHGFVPASLGPRVLRADTAPLAALAILAALDGH